MDAQEFVRIQEAHGLSIALRAAYASDRERRVYPDGAEMFCAMYGRWSDLLCRLDDPAILFDPTGWQAHYRDGFKRDFYDYHPAPPGVPGVGSGLSQGALLALAEHQRAEQAP